MKCYDQKWILRPTHVICIVDVLEMASSRAVKCVGGVGGRRKELIRVRLVDWLSYFVKRLVE